MFSLSLTEFSPTSSNASILFESLITSPSASSIILSPYSSANSLSCDTTITSLSLDSLFNVSNIPLPVSLSNAPVGSSAMTIFGSFIIALAIATRCRCPPDNSLDFLSAYPSKSTSLSISSTFCFSPFLFCNSNASEIFSPTVNSLRILYS